MPFEITVAIDPSKRIRKFIENSRTKNKKTDKPTSPDRCFPSESSDKEMRSESITLYRSIQYDEDGFITDQKESDKEEKDSICKRTSPARNEEMCSDLETSENKQLIIVEPKTRLPFFKKLFYTSKKKEDPPQIEIAQTEQNQASDNAVNSFNTLLEDDTGLDSLVGKAFSLNTTVTIQSVEGDKKPNLILSGSIPFKVTTKDGIVNKRVRVKGKLYSPRDEEEKQAGSDGRSYSSTQSLIRMKVNEQFKLDSSRIQKVSWLTSKILTQEEYTHQCIYRTDQIDVPKVQIGGNIWLKKKFSNHEEQEQLRNCTDICQRETSVNIIGAGNLDTNKSGEHAIDHGQMQLPVTSITIARSKTRLIRFTDGTDFTEKVGRNVITLAAPEGILYFPGEGRGDMDGSYENITKRVSIPAINCEDNMFTRSCFQMVKDDGEYALSRSINDTRLRPGRSKRPVPGLKDLDTKTYYPPGNYSHILTDRYNPLTWIYHNFDKTKRFVQEFNC